MKNVNMKQGEKTETRKDSAKSLEENNNECMDLPRHGPTSII